MFGALRDIVPRMLYTRHMEKPDDLLKFYDDEISEQFKQVMSNCCRNWESRLNVMQFIR